MKGVDPPPSPPFPHTQNTAMVHEQQCTSTSKVHGTVFYSLNTKVATYVALTHYIILIFSMLQYASFPTRPWPLIITLATYTAMVAMLD